MMRAIGIGLGCALAACGTGDEHFGDGGAPVPPPPPPSCAVTIVPPVTMPIASPTARVLVHSTVSQAPGTLVYHWGVLRDGINVAFAPQTADGSEISFSIPDAGVYALSLAVTSSVVTCPTANQTINVGVANAKHAAYRIRILPPPGVAMLPIDTIETIPGGATYQLGTMFAAGNATSALRVVDPEGHGVPALLRITPVGPGAGVDAFTDDTGAASVLVPAGGFDVLVVPRVATVAPHRFHAVQPGAQLALDATARGGRVVDPSGAPLAGARVQITADGVPSSLATTDADGGFAVRSDAAPGETVVVEVAPPAGSGLPRLSATSSALAIDQPLRIAYAPNLVRRDLAGLVVARGGAPLAGARVTVVGDSGAGGTITPVTDDRISVVATGAVVIAATTDAGGALPAMPVPACPLTAVIATGADLAVVALDAAHPPASLDAPAPEPFPTLITRGGPIAGAVVDFLPTGALAEVAAPPVQAIADAAGLVSARLAVGGHYDVRVRDPVGRGALTSLLDVAAAALPTTIDLVPAIQLRGAAQLTPPGGTIPQPLAGAAVQILCAACDGVAADRPLAEGTTDLAGRFALPIPDPNAAPSPAAR